MGKQAGRQAGKRAHSAPRQSIISVLISQERRTNGRMKEGQQTTHSSSTQHTICISRTIWLASSTTQMMTNRCATQFWAINQCLLTKTAHSNLAIKTAFRRQQLASQTPIKHSLILIQQFHPSKNPFGIVAFVIAVVGIITTVAVIPFLVFAQPANACSSAPNPSRCAPASFIQSRTPVFRFLLLRLRLPPIPNQFINKSSLPFSPIIFQCKKIFHLKKRIQFI